MSRLRDLLFATAVITLAPVSAHAFDGVVTSIKPVHSLVAGVMEGTGDPHLLLRGAGSPHTYSLRPSDARALENAKIVFWVGPQIETFLDSAMDSLGVNATVVELGDAHGLVKLPMREGGAFEAHEHEHAEDHEAAGHENRDHEHEEEAEHRDDHDEHGHDEAAESGHHEHENHGHGEYNMHVWLDPQNASAMVHEIADALSEADPENAALYAENAEKLAERLRQLTSEISAEVEPVRDHQFVVFHDAYQYFENRFGVQAAGSITVNPDVMPGAERLREIQEKVRELGATCVFAEPQFEPKLVTVAIEGTGARSGTLDPLGATIDDGPALYFDLLRKMAGSLRDCLSQAG